MSASTDNLLLRLEDIKPYDGDLMFEVDGISADDYIKKITEEMNQINFDSIPFDKWDYIIAFSLALIEVAGDFFIGDPQFKHSLANKNGPFVKWMEQFHKHSPNSPLDWQGPGMLGSKGDHRAMTFGHDSLPIARLLYGAKVNEEDSSGTKTGKKIYNGALLLKDILSAGLAIYSVSSGKFIDCIFTKEGTYQWIVATSNQYGKPYDSCNVFVAVFKYMAHLLADFCSSASLPIPGFSLLTHWPDRDVEAFALKLYKDGMNLRTMLLQGIPVAFTEILMRLYVYFRYKESKYTEAQIDHKRNKLLLISHGITAAVNIGKVIITKNPARLNLILIARTFYLVWKVVSEEMDLTNRALTKLEMGVVKNRVEAMQTLILLDKAMYQTSQYDLLIQNLRDDVHCIQAKGDEDLRKFDNNFNDIFSKMQ